MSPANKHLDIASHLLDSAYPNLKDPKIFLAVLENILLGYADFMGSVLEDPPQGFIEKVDEYEKRYGLEEKYRDAMLEVYGLLQKHRDSPVEFRRKEKFIICDEDYHVSALNLDEVRNIFLKARYFVNVGASNG